MRIKTKLGVLLLSCAVIVSSCTHVTWENISYVTPGNAGFSLKKNARVKMIASGEPSFTKNILYRISDEFNRQKDSGIKFVFGENEIADYYILLNVDSAYEVTHEESVPFTSKKFIREKDGKRSGYEEVVTRQGVPAASAAANVSVAIYSATSLDPITYFAIPMNDGDITDGNGNLRENDDFTKEFAGQIGKVFSDMFVNKKRSISTAFPKDVDADVIMVNALKSGKPLDVEKRAQEIITETFDELSAKIEAKNNNSNSQQNEKSLCAFYLLALSMELNNYDEDTLRQLHQHYLKILLLTQDVGLAEACANSLARVEKKAQMAGYNLKTWRTN